MAKKQKEIPQIKTVKCKNCIKYKSGIWIECEGKRLHSETPRVCELFKLKGI